MSSVKEHRDPQCGCRIVKTKSDADELMESERRGNNVGKRSAHTNKGVTAASSAAYLLLDRSQQVGSGGAAGVRGVAVTARPLSGHHGPFPFCVALLHRLHLPAVVQSRLAAEAPSLTLQEDYKLVKTWTKRRHNDQKITVTSPWGGTECVRV